MVKFNRTKLLAYISLLVALNIVFSRFLTIQTPVVKFDFGFVPIAVASILFGPIVGAITGGLGDIFGMFIFSRGLPYFPLFTLNAVLYGIIFGLFLNKDKVSVKRMAFCIAFECLIINFFLTSIWLYIFNKLIINNVIPFTTILTARILLLLLILPVHFFTMYFVKFTLCQKLKPFAYSSKRLVKYVKNNEIDINLGLDRIKYLLKEMGNPQEKLKFIHIAGTNGKGSVCAYLQSVLTESGYRTGKYISPCLIRQEECLTIDNIEITKKEFKIRINQMDSICKKYKSLHNVSPTQFEITTAMAIKYFYDNKCDIVVLETGLGGIDDATNVVENTLVAVITKISLDHQEYLGNSIEEIALKKAGIIKPKSLVVSCTQTDKVKNTLIDYVTKLNKTICLIEQSQVLCNLDISKQIANNIKERSDNSKNKKELLESNKIEDSNINSIMHINETFNYRHLTNISVGIAGTAQIENASLAVESLLILKNSFDFVNITDSTIYKGVAKAKSHARFELMNVKPLVIFDGAHNYDGMFKLNESLTKYFGNKQVGLILCFMKDKDIQGCLSVLNKSFNIYFAPIENNKRATDVDSLNTIAKSVGISATKFDTLENALSMSTTKNDITVIAGSLYQYKNAVKAMEKMFVNNTNL